MFRNTMGKGFHMTFKNGNTISVQWGPGNYCENRNMSFSEFFAKKSNEIDLKSKTAEIAIWDSNEHWITKKFFPGLNDDVVAYLSTDEVLEIMMRVATEN